jgi:hypothetical protein
MKTSPKTRWRRWAWSLAVVAAVAGGVAMYRYERSQQEEIEKLLRAALHEFQAETAEPDPPGDTGQDRD